MSDATATTTPESLDALFQRLFSRGIREVRITPGPPVTLALQRESGPRYFHAATVVTALLLADDSIRRSVVVQEGQGGVERGEEELP